MLNDKDLTLFRGIVKRHLMTNGWMPAQADILLDNFKDILLSEFFGIRYAKKTAEKIEVEYWDSVIRTASGS